MNWTEITQSQNTPIWYVAEIKRFPDIYDNLFVGFSLGQFQEKIIFSGSELTIPFWAVPHTDSVSAATLYESDVWFAQTKPQSTRPDLRTRFPGIAHADRCGFALTIKLEPEKSEYKFDLYIDLANEPFWLASFRLLNCSTKEIPSPLNQANQTAFLRQLANKKNTADRVASTCARIIDICGEQTTPAIFAMLGDALETNGLLDPAIDAYRKAVELRPQEAKFEMRLSQLLTQKAPVSQKPTGTPKGISLSTSGETALTIIVDMLYRSTPSYMYARELFQNELDAIYRRWDREIETHGQSDFTGIVRIEPDAKDPKKLCFWGDGVGMSFEQVTNHLAKLVNSGNVGHAIGSDGEPASPSNFGIGAKTSALPENTEGMVYKTLPFGESEGIEFALWKNPDTFLYEIKAWHNGDTVEHFRRVPVQEFAPAVQKRGSGASATLLGNTPTEDTFAKSENLLTRQVAKEQIRRGIVYFLNSRYFTIPATGLDVQVAEHNTEGNLQWHKITGQKAFLERYTEQYGTLLLTVDGLQVTAHWWILSESATQEATIFNTLGHIGLLWKNELYYNPNESQRNQRLQLNGFGIHFGEERVIIYLEPTQPDLVDSHPSRTKLMYKHRELNPTEFGERFSANMPPELKAYQKSFFSADITGESIEKIRENLQLLGVHMEDKMRQYAAAFFNRNKPAPKPEQPPAPLSPPNQDFPKETKPEEFRAPIPNCIWRDFDAETVLFAAEWDKNGYVIKFNSAWPQYQKNLDMLVADAQSDYPNIEETLLQQECEQQLRFEYFKIVVETLFSSYAMTEYSNWTERMIDNSLLSSAGLTVALQFSSTLRTNVKTALMETFIKKLEFTDATE